MSTKRLVILLLCVVFVATAFAGCGQSNTGTTTAAATEATTATAATATATTQPAEPIKLVFCKPIWGNQPVDAPYVEEMRQELLKRLNIDITVVGQQNPGDQAEKPMLMIASGEQLDFFNAEHWTRFQKSDSIIPINELLNKEGQDILKMSLPQSIKIRTDKDGKIWAIPYEQNPVSSCVLIRKDWLDELGLQVPTTIEEFENVMQAFKEKKNDEGFVSLSGGSLKNSFIGSFMEIGDSWIDPADGRVKPRELKPEYKDFLAKMAEWYKKGYIHKETGTMQYQQAIETFNSGKSSCMSNWLTSIKQNEDPVKANDPNARLAGVPPLKGPKPGAYGSSLPFDWGTVITKNCTNPEAAMKAINYMCATEEGFLLTSYGIEGKHWEWADKEKGIIKKPDGIADADKIEQFGGETPYTTGWLVNIAGKYFGNEQDAEFMKWLNDPTKVNTAFPIDYDVMYDYDIMKSTEKINTIFTLFDEAYFKILYGLKPVEYWDTVVKKFYDNGGDQYIDEITAQYNQAKGIK